MYKEPFTSTIEDLHRRRAGRAISCVHRGRHRQRGRRQAVARPSGPWPADPIGSRRSLTGPLMQGLGRAIGVPMDVAEKRGHVRDWRIGPPPISLAAYLANHISAAARFVRAPLSGGADSASLPTGLRRSPGFGPRRRAGGGTAALSAVTARRSHHESEIRRLADGGPAREVAFRCECRISRLLCAGARHFWHETRLSSWPSPLDNLGIDYIDPRLLA